MVRIRLPPAASPGTNSVIGSTQGPVTSLRIARAHLSADNARCPEAAERAYFKDPVSSYGKMIAELVQQRAITEASGRRKSDPAHILSKSRVIEETKIAFANMKDFPKKTGVRWPSR